MRIKHPYPLTDEQKAEFDKKLWAWQVEDAEGHPLTVGKMRQRLEDAISGYIAMSMSHDLIAEDLKLLERYEKYLWECAHDGALTFEEWEKEYGQP